MEEDTSKHEDRSAAQSRPNEEKREIVEVNKVMFPGIQIHQHCLVRRFRSQLVVIQSKPVIKDDKHQVYKSTDNSLPYLHVF